MERGLAREDFWAAQIPQAWGSCLRAGRDACRSFPSACPLCSHLSSVPWPVGRAGGPVGRVWGRVAAWAMLAAC